jgi:hypothetical protein
MTDCEVRGEKLFERIIKPGTRDVAMYQPPITVYREGLTIEVDCAPFWYARVDSGSSFGWVGAYGKDMEEAVTKAVARLRSLQAKGTTL